eukprot:GFUD01044079.1.p1 GENE.GFUD01044079.1~~GFUD01044079.1.p1  ORF type:complete len:261 (+),score=91.11 GFUD01044079.1:79-861(+)
MMPQTPSPTAVMDMDTDSNMFTNLCLTDKNDFFNSIMTSLTHSVTLQSSHLTDLALVCTGPDGPLPVSVHSPVLSSQSPLMTELLLSVTEPVLVLPEVELNTVLSMLDLLYTGRCVVTRQERLKLVQLLTSLGLTAVVDKLENETCNEEHSPLYPGQSLTGCMASLGSTKFKLSSPSPELECKKCGVKFLDEQAVEFYFHERDCKMNNEKTLAQLRRVQAQNSLPLSSASVSPSSESKSSLTSLATSVNYVERKPEAPTS